MLKRYRVSAAAVAVNSDTGELQLSQEGENELIGDYANRGADWEPKGEPTPVGGP